MWDSINPICTFSEQDDLFRHIIWISTFRMIKCIFLELFITRIIFNYFSSIIRKILQTKYVSDIEQRIKLNWQGV